MLNAKVTIMKRLWCPALLLLCCTVAFTPVDSGKKHRNKVDEEFREAKAKFFQPIVELVFNVGSQVIAKNYTWKRMPVSQQCIEDLELMDDQNSLEHGAYSPTPHWRRQMDDSNGRLESGFTYSHVLSTGDFNECLNLKVWKNTTSGLNRKADFATKYCLAVNGMPIPIPLVSGVCIPASCPPIQAQRHFNTNKTVVKYIITKSCQTDEPSPWDFTSKCIWWLYLSLVILVKMGSSYEIYLRLKKWWRAKATRSKPRTTTNKDKKAPESEEMGLFGQLLLAFSGYSNTKRLLDTSPSSDDDKLGCLHGMRVIGMTLIVMGHFINMLNAIPAWKNYMYARRYMELRWPKFIETAVLSVDTFFTITGFILVLSVIKKAKLSGNWLNPLELYAHRLIRLWPPYALLIAYTIGIMSHTAKSPISLIIQHHQQSCRDDWWKSLLFLQVYLKKKGKCLPQIWYLSCDTFFIFVSPIFLIPLLRKPKIGYSVLTLMLGISLLIPFLLIHLNDIIPYPARNGNMMHHKKYMEDVYNVPWGRMHCFIIGAAAGYFYYVKQATLRMKKAYVAVTWVVVMVVMYEAVFATYPYSSHQKDMSRAFADFFGAFLKPIWALCMCWIIITCSTGYGGFINSFLSWKGFVPISRLTYSAFLVHIPIIHHFVISGKEPKTVDTYYLFLMMGSVCGVTLVFSYCMTILIESPVIRAEAILRKWCRENKTPSLLPSMWWCRKKRI